MANQEVVLYVPEDLRDKSATELLQKMEAKEKKGFHFSVASDSEDAIEHARMGSPVVAYGWAPTDEILEEIFEPIPEELRNLFIFAHSNPNMYLQYYVERLGGHFVPHQEEATIIAERPSISGGTIPGEKTITKYTGLREMLLRVVKGEERV